MFVSLLIMFHLPAAAQAAPPRPPHLDLRPAVVTPAAAQAMMLGVTRADKRIVAVGDHGVVLLSDDDGKTFRQAKAVPRRVTLTSVSFSDARNGWAVGHAGTILRSTDGGETWSLQREDYIADQPLFAVFFVDDKTGVAGGLWSLMLRTEDGGKTWQEVKLPPAAVGVQADYNLFSIFSGANGRLWMTAERGTLYRSDNAGLSWQQVSTTSRATLWAGTMLRSEVLLAAGVRGRIVRSTDAGATWHEINTASVNSITAITQLNDGRVMAVGVAGGALLSSDEGRTFSEASRTDRTSATAMLSTWRGPLLFTETGVIKP